MKEIRISDQYSIYIIEDNLIELHDFHNLTMYREYVNKTELELMILNPERYI